MEQTSMTGSKAVVRLCCLVILCLFGLPAYPATAQGDGPTCRFVGELIVCEGDGGRDGSPGRDGSSGRRGSSGKWIVTLDVGSVNCLPAGVDVVPRDDVGNVLPPYPYTSILFVDGVFTASIEGCTDDEGNFFVPPDPPTWDEVWDAIDVFVQEVNVDPLVRGITGLETFMWYDGPEDDVLVVVVNGWTATATIETLGFDWEMGSPSLEGEVFYDSALPGTRDNPVGSHNYHLDEEVVLEHGVLWGGEYVLAGFGVVTVPLDLGEARFPEFRIYDVIEERSVIVGDRPGGRND